MLIASSNSVVCTGLPEHERLWKNTVFLPIQLSLAYKQDMPSRIAKIKEWVPNLSDAEAEEVVKCMDSMQGIN